LKIKGIGTSDAGQVLQIQWQDGSTSRYHTFWLWDNSLDTVSRDSGNGQRLLSILDVPKNLRITAAHLNQQKEVELVFTQNQRQLSFPSSWLWQHCYDKSMPSVPAWTAQKLQRWDKQLEAQQPGADFLQLKANPDVLMRWLQAVRDFGFARVTGMPLSNGSLCELAELFGFIRETNYGRWFEVRTEVNPINLAYTGSGLLPHTDNPYRDPVPTLQILACMENSAEGGESIVVDGFKAVEILAQESAESLVMLSSHCARFRFDGGDKANLAARRPMIELAPDGELISVRYNNRSVAPLVDIPYPEMPAYYRAYRKFAEILQRQELQVMFKLEQGEAFIVDNCRVLHARNAYSGVGTRWLQGCYADKDGLLSMLRTLENR